MSTNRPAIGLWTLPAHVGASRGSLAKLRSDFAILRALDHPNIVRLHELGSNGQRYYVTGERLEGVSLRTVLGQLLPERVDVHEADDVVRAIGAALVYAHQHDVAHGDVRAENVFVTMDRRFLLTNFLARRVAATVTHPPRPGDDVRGLARLAAELYTGVPSAQALRSAAHGPVPSARLNAIRAVLEAPGKRPAFGIAEFLATAGLAPMEPRRMPPRAVDVEPEAPFDRDHPQEPARSATVRRLVVPVSAVIAVGILVASYRAAEPERREAALQLPQRGLEMLMGTTADTPPAPAATGAPAEIANDADSNAVSPAAVEPAPGDAQLIETGTAEPAALPRAEPEASALPEPTGAVRVLSTSTVPSPAPQASNDAAVLSLGVSRLAAREDHSVVSIDVLRSGDTSREASVAWRVTPDTAHEEEDYADIGTQTLTFGPGATVARALVPLVNDGVRESDESFTVHLSRPRGGDAGPVTATRVTLHDDD